MLNLQDAQVKGKKVFLRVDFNVPIKDGKVIDNNRIRAAVPTIKYLIEKGAIIIIGTHIGRPEGRFVSALSTIPVAQELSKLLSAEVFATDHVIDPTVSAKVSSLQPGQILLLGNLRFNPAEEKNEEGFAQELANYAEIYVNDAFAVSHRADASVAAITNFLPCYAGLLLENEITTLSIMVKNPAKPFVIVIGGAKIKDKAGILENLAKKADKILVGGAVANTFLAASGVDVSKSLVDPEMFTRCREILEEFKEIIVLPQDFEKKDIGAGQFDNLDIGPRTREIYTREIGSAKCVFWNGNMGYTEDEKFSAGTRAIAEAMIKNENTTVIAGGDTAGFVNTNNLAKGISFISTGGGAAMEYLAGDELPGIKALDRYQNQKVAA